MTIVITRELKVEDTVNNWYLSTYDKRGFELRSGTAKEGGWYFNKEELLALKRVIDSMVKEVE